MRNKNDNQLTFGGHLEVLRRMLFRILGVTAIFAILIFLIKDIAWGILLAPSEWDFVTYRYIEKIIQWLGFDFHFDKYVVEMIATDLSSQFMTHVTTSIYLGCLIASPYILYELFCFALPALYENERKYSVYVAIIIYTLFIIGVLMSYFIIFPIIIVGYLTSQPYLSSLLFPFSMYSSGHSLFGCTYLIGEAYQPCLLTHRRYDIQRKHMT